MKNNNLKTDFLNIKYIYLIGIGGIGMSALARYFRSFGKTVGGYDRTKSKITESLVSMGCNISYEDKEEAIPSEIPGAQISDILIIYTPAIPQNSLILNYFKNNGYLIKKRSEVLGLISENYKTLAVAGTHGKTSVSTIIAHIFYKSDKKTNAILGGISKNHNSNLILDKDSLEAEFLVTEADEFDRSFLNLHLNTAVITSMDADHLDIYSDINDLHDTFSQFINRIDKNGTLIIKKGLYLDNEKTPNNVYTYSFNEKADFYAVNVVLNGDQTTFDISTPDGIISDFRIGIPGRVNVENAIAAVAVALVNKIDVNSIRESLSDWTGVKRRFEYIIKNSKVIYIDDYAHHPEEIKAIAKSVKEIYKEKQILGVFQPHLYSRTKDFADEFANELSEFDSIILLDIYPAREEPIPGVSSQMIFEKIQSKVKILCSKENLLQTVDSQDFDLVITIGAGDIDKMVEPLKKMLLER